MNPGQIPLCKNYGLGILLVISITACGGGGGSSATTSAGNSPSATQSGSATSSNLFEGPRPTPAPREYVLFESGQTRPIAFLNDQLYVLNTPDNRLEIFDVSGSVPNHLHSIPVGVEPVALAVSNTGFAWVVNHISDSVSIVDLNKTVPLVVATLLVGDEPRDIVLAGDNQSLAIITTAHRGLNNPNDPMLTTPGIGRNDIWIFETATQAPTPRDILTLFSDSPRALAVSADGGKLFAAAFLSGNRTTVLPPAGISKALPNDTTEGSRQPDTGLIVQFDGSNWVDERNQPFNGRVPFSLPDFDVFELGVTGLDVSQTRSISGVGTIIFNMVVNPVTGSVYVANMNSRNQVRFSGPGTTSSTIRGHVADHRLSVIKSNDLLHIDLNSHLDFTTEFGSLADRERSLSQPMDLKVSSDGNRLYLAAFGSSKIAVMETSKIEDGSFKAEDATHIELSGGGPAGLVLDESTDRIFVHTRFDNGISIINLNTLTEEQHITMPTPEPEHVVDGRRFLYDSRLTSSRGNDACSSCHIFGNNDALAWDLGDPDGSVQLNPNLFVSISRPASPNNFHPMKGPMTTQSMRGLKGHGPMHWRGDRTGKNRLDGETLEEAAFKEFNEAFEAFTARESRLSDAEMQVFTDFIMELSYPPNPIRNLDNSLTEDQTAGLRLYSNGVVRIQTGIREICSDCHPISPGQGIFGTRGLMSDNSQAGERNFKIPHFRDQYQKVGMFGFGFNSAPATGNQIRGFGYNHNGATTSNFIIADLGMPSTDLRQLRSFLFAFPTESPPILGQQTTITSASSSANNTRLSLLIEEAGTTLSITECDLIAKGVINDKQRGWLQDVDGLFISDSSSESPITEQQLLAFASADSPLTFTCAPWGSGMRMGIDRDLDGILDGDE